MPVHNFKTLRRNVNSSISTFKVEPTPEQMEREMKAFTEQLSNDKKMAKAFFQKVGIISSDGKLTDAYKS